MGYGSVIYFVKEYDSTKEEIHQSEIVAMIDMCNMGYSDTVLEFRNSFDTETTFSIRTSDYDDEDKNEIMADKIEDVYGVRIKYASNTEKLYKLIVKMSEEDDYWRFKILKEMIKMFKEYPDVKIVHYGY